MWIGQIFGVAGFCRRDPVNSDDSRMVTPLCIVGIMMLRSPGSMVQGSRMAEPSVPSKAEGAYGAGRSPKPPSTPTGKCRSRSRAAISRRVWRASWRSGRHGLLGSEGWQVDLGLPRPAFATRNGFAVSAQLNVVIVVCTVRKLSRRGPGHCEPNIQVVP